jgi:hypothetical protein
LLSLGEHDRVHHSEPASGDEDLVVGSDANNRAIAIELRNAREHPAAHRSVRNELASPIAGHGLTTSSRRQAIFKTIRQLLPPRWALVGIRPPTTWIAEVEQAEEPAWGATASAVIP